MAMTIRFRQQGRRNRRFFRLVLTDSRSPREGRYIEALGWYNPVEQDADREHSLNGARIGELLTQGALITPKAEALVKRAFPEVIRAWSARKAEKKAKESARNRARRQQKKAA